MLTLCIVFTFSSCKENNEDQVAPVKEEVEPEEDPNALQGEIGGTKFETKGGKVEIVPDISNDDDTLDDLFIQLFNKLDLNTNCASTFRSVDYITFRAPNKVGKYNLFKREDSTGIKYLTVEFSDIDKSEFYNSYDGYIEILSIDEYKVTGELDVSVNNSTYVEGGFEVVFCPE